MFGQPSEGGALDWGWVDNQLSAAPTYWVISRGGAHPHPRPVWGAWHEGELYLSIGSPVIRRELQADPRITVHLDSGTDVVVVEGVIAPAPAAAAVQTYNAKYDWDYDEQRYGALGRVTPSLVTAWRAAGWAGRDSFRETGSWKFDSVFDGVR